MPTFIYGIGMGPQIAFGPGVQKTLVSGLPWPGGVAVDAAGDVFFIDNGGVAEIPAGGGQQKTIVSGLNPLAIAVDGVDDVFIIQNLSTQVVEISAVGQQTTFTLPAEPYGLAADGAGDVFFATGTRIWEVPAGGLPQLYGPGFNCANGNVAIDGAGDLYVADGSNNTIYVISEYNHGLGAVARGSAVAVDAAGDLFVYSSTNGSVVELPKGGGPEITMFNGVARGLAVDATGDLFIDTGGSILEIQRSQAPTFGFAATLAGTSASPQSVTIENVGNMSLTETGLTVGANFAQVAGSGTPADCTASSVLVPGGSCNLSINFEPLAGGALQSAAVLTNNSLNGNPATQSIQLSGTGYFQTTTTLTASPATSEPSKPVVFTATVTAPSGIPTGQVNFVLHGATLATVSLNTSGVATWTISTLPVGRDPITANYAGTLAYTPSSAWVTEAILSAGPPAVVSLAPASGSGITQTFSGVYSDPNGPADLNNVNMLFNTSAIKTSACSVYYYIATNTLYLLNDAGSGYTAGVTPGSNAQISNSQCTLNAAGSAIGVSGNTLTVNVALTFSSTFTGAKNVYLVATDNSNVSSLWVTEGPWTP